MTTLVTERQVTGARFWTGWLMAMVAGALAPAAADAQASGSAPLAWADCRPGQIEVMILGTFHFGQSSEVDILEPRRQGELAELLDRLEGFAPDRIAVEFPWARTAELDKAYRSYLAGDGNELESPNEISQIGFRLARRLGHDAVHAVDVPMNLWHEVIQEFDDTYPESRDALRARWPAPVPARSETDYGAPLRDILLEMSHDDPPGNAEMYAGFLPLVEDEIYAGTFKLRPWYERNLRIVQNIFRAAEPTDRRVLLVIGAGHLRVLKQIMEMTPQLCPVNAAESLR